MFLSLQSSEVFQVQTSVDILYFVFYNLKKIVCTKSGQRLDAFLSTIFLSGQTLDADKTWTKCGRLMWGWQGGVLSGQCLDKP